MLGIRKFIVLVFFFSWCKVYAQTYTFESICTKAIDASFSLKSAKQAVVIEEINYWQTWVGVLPQITFRANPEHYQKLNSDDSSFFSSLLGDETKYQNTISGELRMPITDVGITAVKAEIVKLQLEQRKLESQKLTQNLKLEILEIYANLLISLKKEAALKDILSLQNQILDMTSRLRKSEMISETEVSLVVIETSKQIQSYEENRLQMQSLLHRLSLKTNQDYSIQNDVFQALDTIPTMNFQEIRSLDSQMAELNWHQKEFEKTQHVMGSFPKVDTYGILTYFGKDSNSIRKSINNITGKSWVVGINIVFSINESINRAFDEQRTLAEVEKLKCDQRAYDQQFQQDILELEDQIQTTSQNIAIRDKTIKAQVELEQMNTQLSEQQLLIKTQVLKSKIDSLNEKLALDFDKIKYGSILNRLKILSQGQ